MTQLNLAGLVNTILIKGKDCNTLYSLFVWIKKQKQHKSRSLKDYRTNCITHYTFVIVHIRKVLTFMAQISPHNFYIVKSQFLHRFTVHSFRQAVYGLTHETGFNK